MTDIAPITKLNTPADIVAFLPVLAGLPTRDSLVVAPFEGKSAARALRVGVPAEPTPADARALASTVLGNLARMAHCDGVAVVVYRQEPFAQIAEPWRAALDIVLERLHSSGYCIKDAAIVAGDGWMPFFEGDVHAPSPLAEIEEATRRIPEEQDPGPDLQVLPPSEEQLTRTVTDLVLDRLVDGGETDAFGRFTPTEPPNPIDVLEDALKHDPARANAQTLARVLAQTDSEGAVDRTVLQIAFGPDIASQSWAATLTIRAEAAEAGCSPIELMLERHGNGEDRQTRRIGDLLTGRTSEMPSRERLQAGAELLGRAVAHCTLPDRSWTMCALAWVRWALGMKTAAFDLLDAAQRVDPGNSHVPVFQTAFDRLTPDWLFQRPPLNRQARRRAAQGRR